MASQRSHPKYEYLTSRWGGMKLRIELGERIDKWLENFSQEEQELLLDLLSRFYYYSEEKIKEKTKELYQKFVSKYKEDSSQAVYSKIFKEYGISYSDLLFTSFWLNNNLGDQAEPNLHQLIKDGGIPPVIVIVDDYSGTGKTLIKTLDILIQANPSVSNATFYFLTIHITDRALQQIQDYVENTGIQVHTIFLEKSQETFKKGYLYEEIDAITKRNTYANIYNRFNAHKDFAFGFEAVESLVAFHYNTPNNTLGLFWQDLADFVALFPRHKHKRTTLKTLQQDAKQRKNQTRKPIVYGIEDSRFAVAITYCIAHSKGFLLDNMKDDLGLTASQVDSLLNEMIKQGYVDINNGSICATAKLKSQMFTSRLNNFKKSYKQACEENKPVFDAKSDYIPINFK